MQSLPARVLLIWLASAAVLVAWAIFPELQGADQGPAQAAASAKDLRWQGVSSCAATACHHQNGPKGSKGSEYTTWITCDRHAQAWSVLFDDRSRYIQKNLEGLKDLKDAHPEKNPLCLNCHAMNVPEPLRGPGFSLADGVGCEKCHGPAEKWLSVHHTREWRGKSVQEKQALGMYPTKDLLSRAQLCLPCHVGTPDMEVNHDLIAAGHPRLNFELGAYLANSPRHWRASDDKARYPDFEARAWALGQALAVQASLELLAARAAAKDRPWPEFAEYDCFACHHDLREPSERQKRGHGKQFPGTLPLSAWYSAMVPEALDLRKPGPPTRQTVLSNLKDLGDLMSKPLPDRVAVVQKARGTALLLNPCVTQLSRTTLDRASLVKLQAALRPVEGAPPGSNWDALAQRYLALAAIHQALGDLTPAETDPEGKRTLDTMRKQLEFPRGFNSPRSMEPSGAARNR